MWQCYRHITYDLKAFIFQFKSILFSGTSGDERCELGCNKCGYNWYKNHFNNGNPTNHWNKFCGCCGGTQQQQNVCKKVCIGMKHFL